MVIALRDTGISLESLTRATFITRSCCKTFPQKVSRSSPVFLYLFSQDSKNFSISIRKTAYLLTGVMSIPKALLEIEGQNIV